MNHFRYPRTLNKDFIVGKDNGSRGREASCCLVLSQCPVCIRLYNPSENSKLCMMLYQPPPLTSDSQAHYQKGGVIILLCAQAITLLLKVNILLPFYLYTWSC